MSLGFTMLKDTSKAKYSLFLLTGRRLLSSVPQTVRDCVHFRRNCSMIMMSAVVMILRVWAMYSGSKIVLGALLTLYVMQMVPLVITCIVVSIQLVGM